jgi:hypothetical protein
MAKDKTKLSKTDRERHDNDGDIELDDGENKIEQSADPPGQYMQSKKKKYNDNEIYLVTLKKGGDRSIDIRGKHLVFTARKPERVKGKYLNHRYFLDQESYFTITGV